MGEKILILHVAIFKPLRHSFDYILPPNSDIDPQSLQPGIRILVPFGTKQVIGILLKVDHAPCIAEQKLKPICEIIDKEPCFTPTLLRLYEWASSYYHHPIGEVILGTMPVFMRTLSKIHLTPKPLPTRSILPEESHLPLNSHQEKALLQILAAKNFQTFLLEGVTGSGKTEVYLQAIDHILQKGKQALILVPEINLTPQTITRFEQRFSVPIFALHSKLSDKERQSAWIHAKKGEVLIVIGTRSAIFTPLSNLGIIILDEEHDNSFKQQSGFKYSARDLAIMRGHLEKIPVVLGTATPSLETLYNTQQARFSLLSLPERAGNAVLPTFYLIDIRGQYLEEGLSPKLLSVIKTHLAAGNQVLLFLNRRGFAPVLLCHKCGWIAQCKRCDAKLTIHQKPFKIVCHHCGSHYPMPKICDHCHESQLIYVGLGTERLEQALEKYFPNTPICRIDRDTIKTKTALENALKSIQNGHSQILVGTQMLAKGHHFPNVTLVGVLDSDGGLFSSDFRASEQMGQLILQVAGRSGRAEKPGEVYIQTHHPEHPLLQSLINHGYSHFAQGLLEERKLGLWPPFSFLCLLRAESTQKQIALNFLINVKELTQTFSNKHVQLFGPIPAPMEKKAGHFRGLLLFRSSQRQHLQQWLSTLVPKIESLTLKNKVRWSVDIDPMEMF